MRQKITVHSISQERILWFYASDLGLAEGEIPPPQVIVNQGPRSEIFDFTVRLAKQANYVSTATGRALVILYSKGE